MTTIEKIQKITTKVQELQQQRQSLTISNAAITAALEEEKVSQAALKEENDRLRAELDKVLSELEGRTSIEAALKSQVSQLEEQVETVRSSSGKMDEATRKSFEKQINQYIKEIDRCIAMLSQ